MDMRRAAEEADVIMQRTLSGVKPELRWNHGPSNDKICTDVKNDSSGTGSVKRRIAIMTIVSKERRGNLLGVVERDWTARGYRITSVRASGEVPAIFAATPDDFRMRVAVGGGGQFFFSITTPCFAESAVPDPATEPNTPQRAGDYPQPPDVHDDFWSSKAPLSTSSSSAS
ncbi:hypothetical protein Y717_15470 [Streptomyces scopuliridis RB72]|uniref:Uncharacterized protein n=2 Tax=Streptomyces scopuliridis TaxID=452529 RepID=A0A2T7T0D5_9ACTN|nr:hypothetical protein Y717_15470 [Streptomyces scopuliridis RB72]